MKKLLTHLAVVCLATLASASLQVQTGQFTASTGGATTTVSAPFQGKALIVWEFGKTSGTESALAAWSTGFTDGTHVFSSTWASDDAVSTTNAGQASATVRGLQTPVTGTPTFGTGGNISSVAFNSGNFVVTFNATPSSAWLVNYILIGGTDVTNAMVGNFLTPSTSTGVQHVTGVGFQPDFVIVLMNGLSAAGNTITSSYSFGVASSTSKRWSFSGSTLDGQTTSANVNAMSRTSNTRMMLTQDNSNGVTFAADLSGFVADGFDYNITTGNPTQFLAGYLAIKGGQWDAGLVAKPSTATTQTVTGESFQPKLLALYTSSATAINTNASIQESSFGASDGTNQCFANAIETDAIPTVAKSSGSTTAMLLDRDGTNNPKAAFTSFNSDGWTVTWDNSGAAPLVGWFTATDNVSAPGGPVVLGVIY